MTKEEVITKAKAIWGDAHECNNPDFIAVRAYKTDSNEAMRLGSNGEFYTRGADGWMWQVGTVEDVENAIKQRGEA